MGSMNNPGMGSMNNPESGGGSGDCEGRDKTRAAGLFMIFAFLCYVPAIILAGRSLVCPDVANRVSPDDTSTPANAMVSQAKNSPNLKKAAAVLDSVESLWKKSAIFTFVAVFLAFLAMCLMASNLTTGMEHGYGFVLNIIAWLFGAFAGGIMIFLHKDEGAGTKPTAIEGSADTQTEAAPEEP